MQRGAAVKQDRLETILTQARRDRGRLDSSAFGAFSLTTLGIASVVGAGIFVTTGAAAAKYAGPGVVIAFVLAGVAAGLTALCYAELAAMMPIAGSTYSYAYAAFGTFLAWFIGWDLLLEYLFAASTVAVGWSGYAVSMLDTVGVTVPPDLANPPFGEDAGIVNLPALLVVALTTALLIVGTRQSAGTNNAIVALKIGVLLLFVALLPQFTDANSGWPLPMQILMLGLVHTIGCAVVYTGVGTGARVVLRARPAAAARVVSTVSGIVMVALGVVLLVERLVA